MRDSSQIWERGQLVDVCPAPFHSTRGRGHGASQSLVGAKKIDANVAQQLPIGKAGLCVGTYRKNIIQLYNVFLTSIVVKSSTSVLNSIIWMVQMETSDPTSY